MASGSRRTPFVLVGLLVALALVVYGGYGRHWSWIGINGRTATLWDWLHLLLLPLAAVVLALWLRHRAAVERWMLAAAVGVAGGFAVVVIAGYTIPWAWTGFTGNSLWDWLNLAALPLAVALIPVALELRAEWGRRHTVALSAGAAVFLGLVLAGYLAKWRWTGFTGNTVWDWLHLLLLPLLVPVVIIPVLRPMALARLGVVDEPPEPTATPAEPVVAPPAPEQSPA
ncbi:MAG TPA: hypothetical protein VIK04_08500 [Solirubrobacteraceae bacterium]